MVISALLVFGVIAAALIGKKETSVVTKGCTGEIMESAQTKPRECKQKIGAANPRSKVFSGLSLKEIDEVVAFMKRQLKLVSAENATIKDDYIYAVNDYLPNKKDVLKWLDKGGNRPTKKARVVVFHGKTRKVEDYLVSLTPRPGNLERAFSSRTKGKGLSWKSRPVCNVVESPAVMKYVIQQLETIKDIYFASFTNNLCKKITDCFYANIAPRTVLNAQNDGDRHLVVWFFASPKYVADYYMYPLPLYMVLSNRHNTYNYTTVAVYYNNTKFDSLSDLANEYHKPGSKVPFTFPKNVEKQVDAYGSPRYVSDMKSADEEQRPPQQYYPDGARFTVAGSHVEWLGWAFDIHFRTLTGLQIFDVKYKKERIAYELSMQDIIVMYSGNPPDDFFKNYFDNGWSIGRYNLPLVRGIDCPADAIYLNSTVYAVGEDKGTVLKDAACVFEHRNAIPLRRHYSVKFYEWGYRYAFSMPDSVLIVRQILTLWNYDYIFDYEFHQNGAIEVKVSSTGYVAVTSNIGPSTVNRGLVINPDINTVANLHQHLFNFKLDLDIAGTENNFKTIQFKKHGDQTDFSKNSANWYQMVTEEEEIVKESKSALRYNFKEPKQYVVYNKNKALYAGSSQNRGYRISSTGFSNVVLPDEWPMLKGAASWAKYQIGVTRFNENERTTASYFTQGDPFQPNINFDNFFADDDDLNNVDLVTWVSVGLHHLPTYEDLPVTTTSGKTLSISLIPFNYFKRDPSIHSRDAAVFWSESFNRADDYFYQNDTCLPMTNKPTINID